MSVARPHRRIVALLAAALALALLPMAPARATSHPVSLSEIRIDQPGSDNDEYFELAGRADTSLDGLTYIVIGDGSGGSGVIEAVVDLSGSSIPATGFFVAAESTFTLGSADLTTTLNFENSDNVTHLLVEGFTGANGDDLDTDDDGALDVTPWSAIVDSVALIATPGSGDLVYSATTVGPDGSFVPAHVFACPDGWRIGEFDPVGGDDTPGAPNPCGEEPPPPPPPPPPLEVTKIHDVQGDGDTSPMVGATVAIEGIIVGDFRTPDGLDGFYVQEEDADADEDPLTSEGIFVYDPDGTVGDVGDTVRVTGTVSEFDEQTQLGGDVTVEVIDPVGSVSPTGVILPVEDEDDWERWEGMLVTFPQTLTIVEFFNFDRHNEIILAKGRQYQATNIAEPGSPEADAIIDLNRRSRITWDDGRLSQNPDPALHPNGGEFTLENRFRGGDTLDGVTGVLTQRKDRFGSLRSSNQIQYRVDFTEGATYTAANPRPVSPDDVGGTVKVASFNVLNLFTHIDSNDDGRLWGCGPLRDRFACRGADTPEELERQITKIVAGIIGTGADVVGLQEIENDIYDDDGNRAHDPVLTLVEWLNDAVGDDVWAWVGPANHYNDYPVRNEIIYRVDKVDKVGDPVALADVAFDKTRPGTDEPVGRPPLAQTFRDRATGGVFTVITNHFKSKGSSCDSIGDPSDPYQGNCNLTRVAQSEALLRFVDQLVDASGDPDVLVIGDLNSYAKEDPIDVLVDGGFTDLHQEFEGPLAYTYVFDGQLGYLDHALANVSMLTQVTGATTWHINADEPDILDYDTSFKKDAQDALYEPNAFRSSDHDPVIVGLSLDGTAPELRVTVDPATLWAPNHKLRTVTATVVATDDSGLPVTVELVSVVSSEPDSGVNKGDQPGDIVIVDDTTFELRAERFSPEGRTYTITYRATDVAGNSTMASAVVTVPHDLGVRRGPKAR